jgi:Putative auto-transporter adhesin, head GIN domain
LQRLPALHDPIFVETNFKTTKTKVMKHFIFKNSSADSLFFGYAKTIITVVLSASLVFLSLKGIGQNGPLKGSGHIVNKGFAFTNFDKIELLDLDGAMEVEAGKSFAVSVDIDDNLESLLDASVSDGTLRIKLKGNLNNRMYIEETKIRINISLPQISSVFHRSNGKLTITGISGKNFKIKNTGNGNAYLNGTIEELEIICRDNGSVYADKLHATTINAIRSGNGNIYANEKAKISSQSSGNGDVIIKNSRGISENTTPSKIDRPLSSIQNLSDRTVNLSVKYPVKGSYGIDIKPQETKQEYFPVGTKIYKGNQFTVFKKPVIIITEVNRKDTFIIK